MYWLVATVSFMIASLGGYAFHSFATGLGGVVQGTAQASAGDVARGSFNAGQVNYMNVSAGTTSFGNFSWGTTSFLTTTVLQENVGNITRRGNYVQMSGGRVGDVMGLGWQAIANGDRAGYMALQFTGLALGQDAQMVGFEADTRGGVLGFTAIGQDGTSISYRPGEGGTGVLTITRNGKTLTTKVNSDGSIEGITTGKLSEGIVAMFGQSLAQAWAQELGRVQESANVISELISDAQKVQNVEGLRKFIQKVRDSLKRNLTENAREVLNRILDAAEKREEKSRGYRNETSFGANQQEVLGQGTSVGFGVQGSASAGLTTGSNPGRSVFGRGVLNLLPSVGWNFSDTSSNSLFSQQQMTLVRGYNNVETQRQAKEDSNSKAWRIILSNSTGNIFQEGLSYSREDASIKEFMQSVSKTLQYAQKDLESYKKSLQATNSVEFRSALLPKVFNQLKQEEAQKLQNSGLSKEEIEAKAAMNALARLDGMIERSPKELFKYLNEVSGMSDAEELKKKVEGNTPKEETAGNPPPELERRIENAENKLKGEYSLTVSVGNKKQANALAKKLTQLTGRQAEVIKMGKGYMVSVGGFQSEDLARGLAQGLGLKNYQVVKVEPQQQQPQPQQQPSTPAKK